MIAQRAPHRISTRDRHPMRQSQLEPRRGGDRRVIIGILVASILLLVVGPQIKPVAGALSPVYSPVESAVSRVTSAVTTFAGSIVKAPALESQNQKLRNEIARLTQEDASLPLYRRELRALDSELKFSNLNPHLDIVRTIRTSLGPPGLVSRFEVAAGSNSRVRVNDPVLDDNGNLIGKVMEVAPDSALVGLLNDYNVNVPAMDAQTGALGLVQYRDGIVTLGDVPAGHNLHVGDFVVTSSIGDQIPAGDLIGQISSLQGQTASALNSATVTTAAHLGPSLSYVQIIVKFGSGAKVNSRTVGGHR